MSSIQLFKGMASSIGTFDAPEKTKITGGEQCTVEKFLFFFF